MYDERFPSSLGDLFVGSWPFIRLGERHLPLIGWASCARMDNEPFPIIKENCAYSLSLHIGIAS